MTESLKAWELLATPEELYKNNSGKYISAVTKLHGSNVVKCTEALMKFYGNNGVKFIEAPLQLFENNSVSYTANNKFTFSAYGLEPNFISTAIENNDKGRSTDPRPIDKGVLQVKN